MFNHQALLEDARNRPDKLGKKTLALDLDETLVRSHAAPPKFFDFKAVVPIKSSVYDVFVQVRPGFCNFLVEMNRHYEIVIFTACIASYGD